MKVQYIALIGTIGLATMSNLAGAQNATKKDTPKMELKPTPVQKLYWGNDLDGMIFSAAQVETVPSYTPKQVLRFSMAFNIGFNLNYDFGKNFGLFTGVGIKNIGFIEHIADSTIKRRVYTIGVPLAIKIGNLPKRNYGFIGGGIDVPFNYREKGFIKRGDKTKFNEWFSERTPLIMPYAFIGLSVSPGITLKLQYYPENFLNNDFTDTKTSPAAKPYAAYTKTNLALICIGFDIHYKKPKYEEKKEKEEGETEGEDADTSSN